MSAVLTASEVAESPRRRQLHLIIGSAALVALYCGAVLVIRNAVG